MKLHKPDYTHSNLNISATVAEFLGAPNANATLPQLKAELAKGYEKVVYVLFDGMGIFPLRQNLPEDDFLRKHIVQELLSTFPSTTTCATTSLNTNTLPLEHGWFGWSVRFENIGRNVNIFVNTDSWTNEKLEITESPLAKFPYFWDMAHTDYAINTLMPPFVNITHPEHNVCYTTQAQFFEGLLQLCKKPGKQFVCAYCNEPDHLMHEVGVTTPQTQRLLKEISQNVQKIAEQCKSTLFIITADHGQIDVEGYVYLYQDKKLMEMLVTYPYLEPRAVAFAVKEDQKAQFEEYFRQTYGEDFVLYKSADLVAEGYFGNRGDKAFLLGDYIAVGTYTHKQAICTPAQPKFLGHHTGLTEEMEVPLILISCP